MHRHTFEGGSEVNVQELLESLKKSESLQDQADIIHYLYAHLSVAIYTFVHICLWLSVLRYLYARVSSYLQLDTCTHTSQWLLDTCIHIYQWLSVVGYLYTHQSVAIKYLYTHQSVAIKYRTHTSQWLLDTCTVAIRYLYTHC